MPITGKDPRVHIHDAEALNIGAPPALLSEPVTPTSLWFTRSHAAIPTVDPASYRLTVSGLVDRPLSLSLSELERLGRQDALATLACAGLRRAELEAWQPIPGELPWGSEPISTGRWSGIPLGRVLERAGVRHDATHVEFIGLDQVERNGAVFGFGGSIPLSKAMGEEVLLVDRMNGGPLPPAHGYPLRVVVPGYYGARSVKWLGAIVLRDSPSSNYFQAQAYRVQRRVDPEDPRSVRDGEELGETRLNSAIIQPEDGARLPSGKVRVIGWAIGPGGRTPSRVELSIDGGTSWAPLPMTGDGEFTWRHWETEVSLPAGEHTLVVRAFDQSGAGQPAELSDVWNVKGYANNAWHRITVTAGD